MNVNQHPPLNYWDLTSHYIAQTDAESTLDPKAKLYYQSAMCLINPKQDPPIFGHSPSAPCTKLGCECKETDNADERFLKFVHTTDTIEVELEPQTLIKNKLKSEERPYKCLRPACNKTFLLKHHLTTHEKTHTGERPHVCVHCGKSFTHKYCLNTHLLLHSNERPHQCTECHKRFTLKHHLMSHINVHKRDKPFLCGECGKSFPLKKQLITHEKYHRGERPFVCNDCGDTFAQENHLVMHLRFHGSLTSFVCGECGATFTRKFELDNHERLHGKEPLVCTTCHKEFLQKRTLMTHLKSHQFTSEKVQPFCKEDKPLEKSSITTPKSNKNKKYFCDICFRKFGAKHGLTQHKKRQHNIGSNLFSCHVCSKSFREKSEMLMHKH
ncbi:unnamed protein product [Ceutorhynchus assimilis]|uniref:C2H2-type domain-containing protein n=1 Tax=Ceutorhynchus assimilis TaxID=467358 RepID=A0A9N9QNR1_9CUCU|nr:unnamed protein product [Ceutorhynchus assimilis]